MSFDPATGDPKPYPSHATQWRHYNGTTAWLFNPWTGVRRAAQDVGSDTFGYLIRPPGEPLVAAPETVVAPDQWLIRKRGYYYRPDRAGYTSSIAEAGRYSEAEAKAEAEIEPAIMQAIPLSQAFSESSENREMLRGERRGES
jgi:hypothetical protein